MTFNGLGLEGLLEQHGILGVEAERAAIEGGSAVVVVGALGQIGGEVAADKRGVGFGGEVVWWRERLAVNIPRAVAVIWSGWTAFQTHPSWGHGAHSLVRAGLAKYRGDLATSTPCVVSRPVGSWRSEPICRLGRARVIWTPPPSGQTHVMFWLGSLISQVFSTTRLRVDLEASGASVTGRSR